jgi:RNA polymerase sigma-70 factor (ECF subfamily)
LDGGDSNGQEQPLRHEYGVHDPKLAGTIERIRIAQALCQLSPGYRTTFLLHDMHGYEHYEIAHLRNCSVGNSKSQLHKARRRLRAVLSDKRSQARSSTKWKTSLAPLRANNQPALL